MDNTMTYAVPAYNLVKRIFQTSIETRTYTSLQEKLFDLSVYVSISIDFAIFGGSGSAEVCSAFQFFKTSRLSVAKLSCFNQTLLCHSHIYLEIHFRRVICKI